MQMHLEPVKVTSTCPQSFAELDPDCFGRVLGAGESFRGGAEALLAEPDLPSAPIMKNAARVQSESERLNRTVPDEPDVSDDHPVGAVGSQ